MPRSATNDGFKVCVTELNTVEEVYASRFLLKGVTMNFNETFSDRNRKNQLREIICFYNLRVT